EWDFRTVLPAVSKLAHQEIDLVDLVKRTANYKVMEWDFRSALPAEPKLAEATESVEKCLSQGEMQVLVDRLKNFLHYVATNLVDEPDDARIHTEEIAPNVIRFRLVLVKRDVPVLIGKDGQTATTIRKILKAAAGKHGVHALLQIHSHEEEMAMITR
ncbi:MAG TPA: KH domain-containing protein, partial [Luteolibacter sp.]